MKFSLVESIKSLPALPKTILEIQQVYADPQAGINDLVKVVEKDPMIVANLLKAANSPLYSFGKEIKSVTQAVYMFGMSITRAIAIGCSVRKLLNIDMQPYGISPEKFAEISNLQVALLYNWYSKIDRKKMENLFLSTFLQETGKILIALDIRKENLVKPFKAEIEATNNIAEIEFLYIQETTASVTAAIFNYWKFDGSFVKMIRFSDSYSQVPEDIKEYSTVLNIIKTAVPVNAPFSQESISCALEKAEEAEYDCQLFKEAINSVKESFGIL